MALVDSGPSYFPVQPPGNPAVTNLTLDAADEVAAYVFAAPRAGNVTRLHFRTATVTTGATMDVRLETVGADGLGTGTLLGANTNVAHVLANTDDNLWIRTAALTAAAAVTFGQLLALVIVNPTVSPGTLNIAGGLATAIFTGIAPYSLNPTRANRSQVIPLCALEYDDGVILAPVACNPVATIPTNLALNTGTNPDEAAAYLTVPTACRVIGWYGMLGLAAGADYRVSLYANGNNTPLLTRDYDGDVTGIVTNIFGAERLFSSKLELTAGIYRLGVVPLTANSVTVRYWEVAAAHPTLLNSLSGGAGVHYSQRNRSGISDPDAAAWTEITNRRLMLGLIIDQIEGGSARYHGALQGGLL